MPDLSNSFPIVGVGASAGGLEAFQQLLKNLSTDTGMAFVLVQHLDPKHESALTSILAKSTTMKVSEVQNGTVIEANRVYVIPPNKDLSLSEHTFALRPRRLTQGLPMPIDNFFLSLARMKRSHAIGIVLSGSGSDGMLGLQAIKSEAGITFAQDHESAKFDQMPTSSVSTGCVDFVMPPEAMGQELTRISQHPYLQADPAPIAVDSSGNDATHLDKILHFLNSHSKVDFSNYKETTLRRRILRRMVLNKIDNLKDYAQLLEEKPTELQALYEEVLIHVTDFFRDTSAFVALKNTIFPSLIKDEVKDQESLRVWVPGCSTGQEAYSLAICLVEFLEEKSLDIPVQIFATDISQKAIEKARLGTYSQTDLKNVSEERVRRFFHKVNGNYQMSKKIRDLCIFSIQNMTGDPPFSRLDLVSCRNVLIYLGPVLQKKSIEIFHYALKQPGYLLLGASETIGSFTDYFSPLDKTNKIYSKKPMHRRPHFHFPRHTSSTLPSASAVITKEQLGTTDLDLKRQAEHFILSEASAVIVDENLEITHTIGDTGPYLSLSEGKPTLHLMKMAREGLSLELRDVIHQVQNEKKRQRRDGVRLKFNQAIQEVSIEVVPLEPLENQKQNLLVLFRPQPFSQKSSSSEKHEGDDLILTRELQIAHHSLQSLKQNLQSALETQEAANEELRSANEEGLSNNEELQSTNEELETAKEELQSTNEELATVNDELQHRNKELTVSNSDLINLLTSVKNPVVMLDTELCIRRFTPMAAKFFNLIPTDMGRPMTDITPKIKIPDLKATILDVIHTASMKELEVEGFDGRGYLLRIYPYETQDKKMDGAVLALVDVHGIKLARDVARSIVQSVQEPLLVLDKNFHVLSANRSFYSTFNATPEETENHSLYQLGNGQWKIPKLRALLEEILPKKLVIEDYEVEHHFETLGNRVMLLNARQILSETTGSEPMILLAIEDITLRKTAATRLQKTLQELSLSNAELETFASRASHDLTEPLRTVSNYCELLSYRYGDKLDKEGGEYIKLARDSSIRMMVFIRELLEYSQLGKIPKPFVLTNARQPLDLALENLKAAIDETGAKITCAALPEVLMDPRQFVQLFQNLIANAIKFHKPKDIPRITVAAEKKDVFWLFSVRDEGIGMEEKNFSRIFDIFQRLHSLDQYAGTGIGLASCKKIVELHGGKIYVESQPNKGSTFYFSVPAAGADGANKPT